MKTTDELVRELIDREAIRDLAVRYCDCLRRKDVEGLVGLFTADATFVMKGIELEAVSHGHAQIKRMHEKALAETTPRLFTHNQIVNLAVFIPFPLRANSCLKSQILSILRKEPDGRWVLFRDANMLIGV